MRTLPSDKSLLAAAMIMLLGVTATSCTHPDEAQAGATARKVRAEATSPSAALSLHPPIALDAGDGHVHEYY